MLEFDAEAARQVEAVYLIADVGQQRREVLRLLGLTAGEAVLDIGSGPGLLATDMAQAVGPAGVRRLVWQRSGASKGVPLPRRQVLRMRGSWWSSSCETKADPPRVPRPLRRGAGCLVKCAAGLVRSGAGSVRYVPRHHPRASARPTR
jgi:hypothetical protein